jgi:hypothetical protein
MDDDPGHPGPAGPAGPAAIHAVDFTRGASESSSILIRSTILRPIEATPVEAAVPAPSPWEATLVQFSVLLSVVALKMERGNLVSTV